MNKNISIALILTTALGLILVYLFSPTGYISIDETIYHLLAKEFYDHASFSVSSGYREFPSEGFIIRVATSESTRIADGGVISSYPYLNSILPLPFYALAGYRGLFIFNFLCLIGTSLCTYRMGLQMFNRSTAILSAFIFLFCTYAFDYGLAAWPHMSSLFFITLMFNFLIPIEEHKNQHWHFILAGFFGGIGMGLRLDVLFSLSGAALSLAIRKNPFKNISWFALGLIIPLLALSWSNYLKMGIFFPIAYGKNLTDTFSPFLKSYALAVPVLLFLCLLVTPKKYLYKAVSNKLINTSALLLALIVFWKDFSTLLWGMSQMLFNLNEQTLLPSEYEHVSKSDLGHIQYLGGFKRSLFQSCPYMAIVIFSLFKNNLHKYDISKNWHLALIPLPCILFYSYFHWQGGLSLNLRYLTPALPFFSCLSAAMFTSVLELPKRFLIKSYLYSCALFGLLFVACTQHELLLEVFIIYLSQALILCVFIASIMTLIMKERGQPQKLLSLLLTIGLGYATTSNFIHDVSIGQQIRALHSDHGKNISENLEKNCFIFGPKIIIFHELLEEKDCIMYAYNPSLKNEIIDVLDHFDNLEMPLYLYNENPREAYEWTKEHLPSYEIDDDLSFPYDGFFNVQKIES